MQGHGGRRCALFGIELTAALNGVEEQFAECEFDRFTQVRSQIGVEMRHKALTAIGSLALARYEQLNPRSPRGDNFKGG